MTPDFLKWRGVPPERDAAAASLLDSRNAESLARRRSRRSKSAPTRRSSEERGIMEGHYDADGNWIAGRGYYDANGNWVSAAGGGGYYDADGKWVSTDAEGHYDADGNWIAGRGYYDANGNWVSAAGGGGYYDADGKWVSTDAEGHYDADGNWIAGRGYYDASGNWISTDGGYLGGYYGLFRRGPNGEILDADGNPVLGADGAPLMAGRRKPVLPALNYRSRDNGAMCQPRGWPSPRSGGAFFPVPRPKVNAAADDERGFGLGFRAARGEAIDGLIAKIDHGSKPEFGAISDAERLEVNEHMQHGSNPYLPRSMHVRVCSLPLPAMLPAVSSPTITCTLLAPPRADSSCGGLG